jgi:putative oxidoreductase
MKIVKIILRTLLGALLLFGGLNHFFDFVATPIPTGEMKTIMDGFVATKYLLPLVKIIEILVGLAFLSGKFMRLAVIVLLPISVNILLINTIVAPEGIAIGLFVFVVNLLFIYDNKESYKDIFAV